MEQYVPLSRAAKLVGVSRGQLQKKIRSGELGTFEGNVLMADLLKAYPDAQPYQDVEFNRVNEIKSKAFSKRVHELILPDAEVLFERLNELAVELSNARGQFTCIKKMVSALKAKLRHYQHSGNEQEKILAGDLHEWVNRELGAVLHEAEIVVPLLVQDTLLRLVTAHVNLVNTGHEFFIEGNSTILESATKAGFSIPYGCNDGSCGMCKARIVDGHIKKIRKYSYYIPEEEQVAGYVLTCANTAVSDLKIEVDETIGAQDLPQQTVEVSFKSYKPLSDTTGLLTVMSHPSSRFRYLAGQWAELDLGEGLARKIPLTSCPCDDRKLQFHIRHDHSRFNETLTALRTGQALTVSGPHGDFLFNIDSPRVAIFIVYETGFMPVNSLIEHAIALNMAEKICLYWVASESNEHYLNNLCRAWNDALDDFRYTPLIYPGSLDQNQDHSKLHTLLAGIKRDYNKLSECDFYIAGPDDFILICRQYLTANGALTDNIRSNTVPDCGYQ